MKLNNFKKHKISKKKRVGRGFGSGKGGHTIGKGSKGQKSRTGYKQIKGWIRESKIMTLPKLRGIGKRRERSNKERPVVIKLAQIEKLSPTGKFDKKFLLEKGLIKEEIVKVRIIAGGKFTKKLEFSGVYVTKGAKTVIESVGGSVK